MSDNFTCFFDTNILGYLGSDDTRKADIAEGLLAKGGTISVQVLNEFANVLRKKQRRSWSEARAMLDDVRPLFEIHPVTLAIHELGLDLAERHGFQLYDAMIVAAALDGCCDVLWSEDMHDGLVVDGRLTIRNPFATGRSTDNRSELWQRR